MSYLFACGIDSASQRGQEDVLNYTHTCVNLQPPGESRKLIGYG